MPDIWMNLAFASVEHILPWMVKATEETETKLNDLIEAPLTSGKGFLKRAQIEQKHRKALVIKAQDKFTELIEYASNRAIQSRACFFVAHCHKMLGNNAYVNTYLYDACKAIIEAVEIAEKQMYGSFWSEPNLRWNWELIKGISYEQQEGFFKKSNKIYYPIKDDYMKALDKLVGVRLPLCSTQALGVMLIPLNPSAVESPNM